MPVRLQMSRSPGWKAPVTAKYVGRPTFYGNPFSHLRTATLAEIIVATREASVDSYEAMVTGDPDGILGAVLDTPELAQKIATKGEWIRTHLDWLVGKDLLCWCPLDGLPCHAATLLRLAN